MSACSRVSPRSRPCRPRKPRFESAHQGARLALSPQRRLEPLALVIALLGRFERALQDLQRAIAGALSIGDLAQRQQHLAPPDGGRRLRRLVLPAEHRQEGAVRALRSFQLPVVTRQLRQRLQDLRIGRIDTCRRVELDERVGPVAHRQIEPREVEMDRRAFLGTTTAEALDHPAQEHARLVEALSAAERIG